MRYRKSRRFRPRSNGRGPFQRSNNGVDQSRMSSNPLGNGRGRNNFKTYQSAEKLVERYNSLAKEALSSGDRILSENYSQHADHYMRIVDNKNINQAQNKTQTTKEIETENISENLAEKKEIEEKKPIEEKKE